VALEHFVLNHRDYYLLISDYRMPGMNGLEFLQKVKETDLAVPCMLISAFNVEDDGLFKNYGCVDKFLQKPIEITELIHEVQMYAPIREIMYPKV
jgi:CheY-like chemotaxis protein